MSEFTNNGKQKINDLQKLFYSILNKDDAANAIKINQSLIDQTSPSDIIILVDKLVGTDIPMDRLKTGINKFLNIAHTTLKNYPYTAPKKDSYLDCCIKNNAELDTKLKALRPSIKEINRTPKDQILKKSFVEDLKILLKYDKYYSIKENILFPLIEKETTDFHCINVMWSFHDDIRANLKRLISILSERSYDLKEFNKLIGDVFFKMFAIIFREERILFPFILETISQEKIDFLFSESIEIGFPYYEPKNIKLKEQSTNKLDTGSLDLKTGNLTAEQIILIFNHLPVDITYVDENNRVKFFSTPKKRIFTRSNAIIGREVTNCHPPDSVHVVEQIIESFKNGSKDKASFWIKMKGDYILIQYFAARDEKGNYKGVIEVSQEIEEIRNLKGEKRLLDWED